MLIAAAILAAAAAPGSVATASAATSPQVNSGVVTQAALPGSVAAREVRRTPAVVAADLTLSPGCSSATLPINCTITESAATQPQTSYPLSFLPGDHVTVTAGGCVQTGGNGLTWKRYVDPASDNDLYHGLITVPGATGVLDELLNVVNRQFTVGGRGDSLVLSYQDDGYGDNGY
jgi:hypothetical protein